MEVILRELILLIVSVVKLAECVVHEALTLQFVWW